jgi:hypothetical protein
MTDLIDYGVRDVELNTSKTQPRPDKISPPNPNSIQNRAPVK